MANLHGGLGIQRGLCRKTGVAMPAVLFSLCVLRVLFVLGRMSMEECGSLLRPRDPEVIAIFMWKAAKQNKKPAEVHETQNFCSFIRVQWIGEKKCLFEEMCAKGAQLCFVNFSLFWKWLFIRLLPSEVLFIR